jgi:hypothetical protein
MIMLASIQAALRINQPLMGDGQGLDGGEGGSEAAGYDGSDGGEVDDKQHMLAAATGDGLAAADGAGYAPNDEHEPAAKRVKVERE